MLLTLRVIFLSSLFFTLSQVLAIPAPDGNVLARRYGNTQLDPQEIDTLMNYIQFSRTGYCAWRLVESWQCGEPCTHLNGISTIYNGGNGADQPRFHLLYWQAENAVVVVYEGTSVNKVKSIWINLNWDLVPLGHQAIWGNFNSTVQVHKGYIKAHSISANIILKKIRATLRDGIETFDGRKYPAKVVTVGYSMGGAVALLGALHLRLNLDPAILVQTISVGSTRVGNTDFGHWVDGLLPIPNNVRVVNGNDYVYQYPFDKDFVHPGEQIHVHKDGTWWKCTDFKDIRCQQSRPHIGLSSLTDHWELDGLTMVDVCEKS